MVNDIFILSKNMHSSGVVFHMVWDGEENVCMGAAYDGGDLYTSHLSTSVSKGVSIVDVMCDWASTPVCTAWCFCLLSDLNDRKGFFVGFSFLCMCGGLSMVSSTVSFQHVGYCRNINSLGYSKNTTVKNLCEFDVSKWHHTCYK